MIKKNLLATLVLLFSVLFISGNIYSQQNKKQNKTPEEMATKMADKMKKNLSLTDDQYKQVYMLFLNQSQERINNKAKYQSMDKASRQQMKKQNKESFKKQLEGILTKEQIQKLQQQKGKHGHKNGNMKQKNETKE
jgi:hypothetical protein